MGKATILHYIREYAKTQPEVFAVCELNRQMTYAAYWSAIRKTAGVLIRNGIGSGEHVILRCTQNIDYVVLFSALQYMQALVIPVERSTSLSRMEEIVESVDADWVISNQEVAGIRYLSPKDIMAQMQDAEEAELPMPETETESMLLFTTGTTGTSKGVLMRHKGDVAIAENVICGTQMKKGNVEIIPMPLNHSFGIRRYQSDMVNGGTVCLLNGMAMIGNLWKMLERYHASSMAISPATLGMIFHLADEQIADYADQIEYIQIGSAPLPEADKEKLLRCLPKTRLYNFYGSSEAGCSCILEFSRKNKAGCIGYPTVNSVVRFLDENGQMVENGTEEKPALLCWGGPIVMAGYYKDLELTEKTVVDGFVLTNDLGYLDEDGRCILIGRADDVINYGGSKISPAEIEAVVGDFPGIADCAYSSVKDAIVGELPVLLIVKENRFDADAFQKFLQEHLESYKLPQKIYETKEIPKTFKGSLLRKEIRKIAEENYRAENLKEKNKKTGEK